jgi:hypothetical protein
MKIISFHKYLWKIPPLPIPSALHRGFVQRSRLKSNSPVVQIRNYGSKFSIYYRNADAANSNILFQPLVACVFMGCCIKKNEWAMLRNCCHHKPHEWRERWIKFQQTLNHVRQWYQQSGGTKWRSGDTGISLNSLIYQWWGKYLNFVPIVLYRIPHLTLTSEETSGTKLQHTHSWCDASALGSSSSQ